MTKVQPAGRAGASLVTIRLIGEAPRRDEGTDVDGIFGVVAHHVVVKHVGRSGAQGISGCSKTSIKSRAFLT